MTGRAADGPARTLLSVEGLGLAIHGRSLLHGIDLSVRPGRVLGVIGESGSGKSLTALSVMGLLPVGARTTGRVHFGGRDLLGLGERAMCGVRGRDIGMIFQEPMTALNPLQMIGHQVAETIRIHGAAPRARAWAMAAETLARVGLPPARFPLSRYPHELSGGQRQRVGIAMAIALRPKLLIADEPTTALDVTTQAAILDLLRRLVADDGMGLLLISHDLAVVAETADEIAVMQAGRVVEAGPTQAVLTRQAHPYTRALFAASTHLPVRRARSIGAPLLEVEGLVREYRTPRGFFRPAQHVTAVRDVSLAIGAGESLGLVGESGCGKSTLARAILGLEAVQGGSVRVGGVDIHAGEQMPRAVRARMQVVFQDPYGSFNPRHRVERLITEPFHLLDDPPRGAERAARVAAALREVGLAAGDAERYVHEFSGGQRQRLAIARALITRPDLIVLDEAVSALDVQVRAQILDLLAGLQGRLGASYLFITHDLGVVRAITDRVAVMRAGEIVETGPTEQVLSAPVHPYTRALIAATPVLRI